jgi:hypothetical protein
MWGEEAGDVCCKKMGGGGGFGLSRAGRRTGVGAVQVSGDVGLAVILVKYPTCYTFCAETVQQKSFFVNIT